jgi:hypothetical protein
MTELSEADKAIWDELDDMSKAMLDSTIVWQPKTRAQRAIAGLIRKGKLIDSGQRRRGVLCGKLQIVWITDTHVH